MGASIPQRVNERKVYRVAACKSEQNIRELTHVQQPEIEVRILDNDDRVLIALDVSNQLIAVQGQVGVLGSKQV